MSSPANDNTVLYRNRQWVVSEDGIDTIDGRYFIGYDSAFRDGFQARRLRPTIQGSLGKTAARR